MICLHFIKDAKLILVKLKLNENNQLRGFVIYLLINNFLMIIGTNNYCSNRLKSVKINQKL